MADTALICEIKRFAVHDGDGIRTTVFFKGCPLKCRWCHNPETISPKPQLAYFAHKCVGCGNCLESCSKGAHKIENGQHIFDRTLCVSCGECTAACFGEALKLHGTSMTVSELLPLLLEDRDFYETSGGGVTLSGGECLTHAHFCAELLKQLKENSIHTAVDTCGFVSKAALDAVIPYTDVFLYDIKAIEPHVHEACTGQRNEVILENLRYLDSLGKAIEIRIPYVPEHNSGQMEKIAAFLAKFSHITKVKVLPYHNYAGSKYDSLGMENTLPPDLPTEEEVAAAQNLFA